MGLSEVLESGGENAVKRMPLARILLRTPSYVNIFVVPSLYTICIYKDVDRDDIRWIP
jgi:hypothetical protein